MSLLNLAGDPESDSWNYKIQTIKGLRYQKNRLGSTIFQRNGMGAKKAFSKTQIRSVMMVDGGKGVALFIRVKSVSGSQAVREH